MKHAHKEHEEHHRHERKSGGKAHETGKASGHPESAEHGKDEWEEDEKSKPEDYTAHSKVAEEAEEKKHGGRAKRKHGGKAHMGEHHHEHGTAHHMRHKRKAGGKAEKKHVGEVHGEHAHHHAGRKPRKAGGRAACEASPFTTAHKGEPAPGRKLETKFDD